MKETRRISMAEKKDNVTSKFKDNVFCMLYRDKKNLLELYNALNNSAYTNVDDLQVTTLNGGSYMKYKNDASFLLCMSLYMFEQQSSKNPNSSSQRAATSGFMLLLEWDLLKSLTTV